MTLEPSHRRVIRRQFIVFIQIIESKTRKAKLRLDDIIRLDPQNDYH